jgi:hypothetical protein
MKALQKTLPTKCASKLQDRAHKSWEDLQLASQSPRAVTASGGTEEDAGHSLVREHVEKPKTPTQPQDSASHIAPPSNLPT